MAKEKIVAEDYLKLKFVEQPHASKNYLCWVERSPDSVDKGYKSKIMLMNLSTRKIKAFTSGSKRDFNPQISPNEEQIAFLSTRGGKSQLFLIDLHGGEAISLTSMKRGVQSFNWSPDGSKISFISKVKDNEDWDEKPNFRTHFDKEREELAKKEETYNTQEPRILSDHVYRTGVSYNELGTYSHIFVYDFQNEKTKQISVGDFSYSNAAWFDNTTLYATTVREKPVSNADHAMLVKFDISENISEGQDVLRYPATFLLFPPEPKISPTQDIIIGSIITDGIPVGQISKIGLVGGSNKYSVLNDELDRSITKFEWLTDQTGLALVEDSGLGRIYSYTKPRSLDQLFEPTTCITDFSSNNGQTIYYTSTSPNHPFALWSWDKENGEQLIIDPNEELLSKKTIIEPEEFWLTNPEGIKYQGWYFDAGVQDGKKPPMILSIHGGPDAMWNNAGTMWHEWQMQVAAGYSVLAVNPIGSGGYGEKFAQLIISKWGDDDARDLLLAVDHFHNRVDTDRLYITGGSYGGFQTANIISKDHRFKAACAQRGVYNVLTFWMSTDIPLWATHQFGWDYKKMDYNLDHLWKHSPTANAYKVKTPVLIIHSEADYRVQISQAEDFFGVLRMHDVEAKLVRYPRDGHELSRSGEPIHLIDRLEKMLDWFNTHP